MSSTPYKIALVQQAAGEDRQANRTRGLAAVRRAAAQGANIVAFSELAFDPFWPQVPAGDNVASKAEPVPGPTTNAFSTLAAELGVAIVLNVFEIADEQTFDTSPVIDADGSLLGRARMVHITEYEHFHEQGYYSPGNCGAPVFDTAFGRIGVAICYDRHFPEYLRALALAGADTVFIPQAGAIDEWPEGLYEAEVRVAAFQNGFYAALCNRVGPEPKLVFAGESFVSDPMGRVIARAGRGTEEILYATVDPQLAADSHGRKLFLADRRPELYEAWICRDSNRTG